MLLLEAERKEAVCGYLQHVCKVCCGVRDLRTDLFITFGHEVRADQGPHVARKHDVCQMLSNSSLADTTDAARHQKDMCISRFKKGYRGGGSAPCLHLFW